MSGQKGTKQVAYEEKITFEEVKKWPILEFEEYGMTLQAAKYFQVRSCYSEKDGKTIEKTAYPYYNQSGVLCGFKLRHWDKDRKHKYHITCVGTVGIDCKMFGQKEIETHGSSKKDLFFLEGEGDVVSAWAAAMENMEAKWRGIVNPTYVGLQLGAGNAVEGIVSNQEFVNSFDKRVMAFDNDYCTPKELKAGNVKGKECSENVAQHLVNDVYIVHYPHGYKDARAMYTAGKSFELAQLLKFPKNKYTMEKIVRMSDLSIEFLTAPAPRGFLTETFPKLDEKLLGFRKKELVLITAPSGVGKTTICSEIVYSLLAHNNQKIGYIFLEEGLQNTALRLIAKDVKVNYNKFKFDPLKYASLEQISASKEKMDNKAVYLDHFGKVDFETLRAKVDYMAKVEKVDFIVLDHLSMVFVNDIDTDERKLIDSVMTDLAAYVASSDVGILAVSHIKRIPQQSFPKDRSTGEKLPYWQEISMTDMRGGAALEQLSWIVLILEQLMLPTKERGPMRITVSKNRPTETLGIADIIEIDKETGEILCIEDPLEVEDDELPEGEYF